MSVEEKYHGKGYGRAILNHLIETVFQNYNIE
ncbi:GNAT family N-acetyltransferase [Alkaliphilus sp. B6464]|nr:GNAT family N-acetyltransferase [Alkaliphilus sp. B6464]